jgi:protein-tyrosine phosphatase
VARERQRPVRILFVCMGNICRSPTAEATMRALVREAGLEEEVELDSAGTGSWHVGSAPDRRAAAAAKARGIALEGTAREVSLEDFEDFQLLLAMDRFNLEGLRLLAPSEQAREKVRLLREFDPASGRAARAPDPHVERVSLAEMEALADLDVPDPYYGGDEGFEEVLDLVQAACEGLLERIRAGEVA